MLEKDIEGNFCEFAESNGCRAEKLVYLVGRGFPDRTIFLPGGRIFFIEFKKPDGGKVSPQQKLCHKWLRRFGFRVYVCDNVADAVEILNKELLI